MKRPPKARLTFIALACLTMSMYCACASQNDDADSGVSTMSDSTVSQAKHPEFVISPDEEKKLRVGLEGIHIGDSQVSVLQRLGAPSLEKDLVTKTGDFRARAITYYFVRWEDGFVNEHHDRSIQLFFDRNGRLFRMVSNVDGIASSDSEVK